MIRLEQLTISSHFLYQVTTARCIVFAEFLLPCYISCA